MMESPFAVDIVLHLGPVPISSDVLVTALLVTLLGGGAALATRRPRLRPGRLQAALELLVIALDGQISETLRAPPMPYRALIGTLFLFILVANSISLLPGIESPTATLETDAALALIAFAATVYFGVRTRGIAGYLKSFAEPVWLMIPINVFGQITRMLSMTVRLFGNVMSGAFIIAIVLSLAALIVPIPLMALDLLTGAVQAWIFAVLTTVFIGAAIETPSRSQTDTGTRARSAWPDSDIGSRTDCAEKRESKTDER